MGIITLCIPNFYTESDLKAIRECFNKGSHSKNYRLNIIVSGNTDIKITITNFVRARLHT